MTSNTILPKRPGVLSLRPELPHPRSAKPRHPSPDQCRSWVWPAYNRPKPRIGMVAARVQRHRSPHRCRWDDTGAAPGVASRRRERPRRPASRRGRPPRNRVALPCVPSIAGVLCPPGLNSSAVAEYRSAGAASCHSPRGGHTPAPMTTPPRVPLRGRRLSTAPARRPARQLRPGRTPPPAGGSRPGRPLRPGRTTG